MLSEQLLEERTLLEEGKQFGSQFVGNDVNINGNPHTEKE